MSCYHSYVMYGDIRTSHDHAISVEDKLKELAKPGTVVVHYCPSIPKCLQYRIYLQKEQLSQLHSLKKKAIICLRGTV